MSEFISIRDLLVRRNGRDVLTINSLEIQRGQTLAIVGPNGAGKSTLLLVLARLIKPARGQITFNGSPIAHMDDLEYRRKISFVFQDPLLMDMSVEKNIALGLKFRGTNKEEIHTRVIKWSKAMGVDALLGRRASQLSGGEAQRVSLARAFVLDPELLLMDEPFSAVDPQTRGQLMKDLSELLAHEHRTTIFVTHNLKEAEMLASSMAVILNSRMQQVGPPGHIRLSPANAEVADFFAQAGI
jgi:tungstate transport system ATP-binding protein